MHTHINFNPANRIVRQELFIIFRPKVFIVLANMWSGSQISHTYINGKTSESDDAKVTNWIFCRLV